MHVCVRTCLYFGFKIKFCNLDKFNMKKRNVFQAQEKIIHGCTAQKLADGWSLSAFLVATEHSSDTYTGLSDESLISECITFSSMFPLVFLVFYH